MRAQTHEEPLDLRLITALGVTQIISWGSVYYSFALLIDPLQEELGGSRGQIVGAFSVAMLVGGLAASWVGRHIDLHGGRAVMTIGSAAVALLLALHSQVQSIAMLYVLWGGLGLAMAATLYEPAFAVLTRTYPTGYRRAITLLTLFGGLASTVFWPLGIALIEALGWRDALLVLAAINVFVCVPLHAWLLAPPAPGPEHPAPVAARPGLSLAQALRTPLFYALAGAFLCHMLVISAISVHLIALLLGRGLSGAEAALIGALIGPMQVAGRVAEYWVGRRWQASRVGILAFASMVLALLTLQVANEILALLMLFALLYGAGNGTMTIVRGAVPVEFFGRGNYGAIAGALATPALLARAGGPLLAALLWTALGSYDGVVLVLTLLTAIGTALYLLALRWSRVKPSQVR